MPDSIFEKVTLNNGYRIPVISACPDMPDSYDIDDWQRRHPGVVPFLDTIYYLLRLGFRSFDTGKRYDTEDVLGRVFRECGIQREELFITTKIYHDDHGREGVRRYVDDVLKRTGLDYIDLFLIHCPITVRGLYAETYSELTEFYRQGVIKAVGVSNFGVQHFYDLAEVSDVVPAVNQYEQHPFYLQPNLLAYQKKHGITPMSYSPLGHGYYAKDPRIAWIAEKHGKTIAQVILRWHLQKGFIPVTRSSNDDRMRENSEIFDFKLDPVDMAFMETLNHGSRVWHDPFRFPGSRYYIPVENHFYDVLKEELQKRGFEAEREKAAREYIDHLMASEDIDGTKDYIIFCFARAEAKYGRCPEIGEYALQEAELLVSELLDEFEKGRLRQWIE